MQSRHSGLLELGKYQIPVAAAACFFVSALFFSGAMAVSPRANAVRALHAECSWISTGDTAGMKGREVAAEGRDAAGGKTGTDDVGISPLILRNLPDEVEDKSKIRRISVKKIEVIPTDGGEEEKRDYRYRADYDIALEKGDRPETPVIAGTAEGEILMERKGIFGWKTAEIR